MRELCYHGDRRKIITTSNANNTTRYKFESNVLSLRKQAKPFQIIRQLHSYMHPLSLSYNNLSDLFCHVLFCSILSSFLSILFDDFGFDNIAVVRRRESAFATQW